MEIIWFFHFTYFYFTEPSPSNCYAISPNFCLMYEYSTKYKLCVSLFFISLCFRFRFFFFSLPSECLGCFFRFFFASLLHLEQHYFSFFIFYFSCYYSLIWFVHSFFVIFLMHIHSFYLLGEFVVVWNCVLSIFCLLLSFCVLLF